MKGRSDYPQLLIPHLSELNALLNIESCLPNYDLISSKTLDPLNDFLSVDGKRIRATLVEIAFLMADGKFSEKRRRQLHICEQIIEGLHAGSMIIDDIQDQSEVRRGRPTLHRRYGVGVALNSGNWLYFQSIDLIQKLELKPDQELALQRNLNKILLKAHFGQGIDVGVDLCTLPQSQVESLCFSAMELKTGALMELAFDLGATIANPNRQPNPFVSGFGRKFGIALQIFDDIGNYLSAPPKGKEDIKRGRPSFIWITAARLVGHDDFQRFQHAAKMLPDTSYLDAWEGLHNLVPEAKRSASGYLQKLKEEILQNLKLGNLENSPTPLTHSNSNLIQQLESLLTRLEKSYA